MEFTGARAEVKDRHIMVNLDFIDRNVSKEAIITFEVNIDQAFEIITALQTAIKQIWKGDN